MADKIYFQNTKELENSKKVYDILKRVITGEDLEFTYGLDETDRTVTEINIRGKNMCVKDNSMFVHAAMKSSGIGCFPLTNGLFEITLFFDTGSEVTV